MRKGAVLCLPQFKAWRPSNGQRQSTGVIRYSHTMLLHHNVIQYNRAACVLGENCFHCEYPNREMEQGPYIH